MTCIPYPTFYSTQPTTNGKALSAVGHCRIYPNLILESDYNTIVSKCIAQSQESDKKERKKLMKQSVALASAFLSGTCQLDASVIDVEIVLPCDKVMESDGCLAACWLDGGASKIVMEGKDKSAMECARLPRDRVVASFDYSSTLLESGVLNDAAVFSDTINVNFHKEKEAEEGEFSVDNAVSVMNYFLQQKDSPHKDMNMIIQLAPSDAGSNDNDVADVVGSIGKKCQESHHGSGLITLMDPTPYQLGMSYASCMKTDRPDGLYTTVVCTRSNEALGLVYSSKESVIAALECGRGVYYSRSRNGLWRKGDTSGHYQILHRIDVDCDGDALRFTVTQKGEPAAFCHLNTLTCWGQPKGVRHLEETLHARLNDAPEGSYTKRLFEDEELLRDKLVEEAQELSEAETKEDVAGELADVLYFAMVRAAKAGVSMDDAAAVLDARSKKVTRRQGDSKAFRIEAGNKILGNN